MNEWMNEWMNHVFSQEINVLFIYRGGLITIIISNNSYSSFTQQ
jgi:hypothetical protein